MTKWKIGIIGAGLIADFHARAIGDIAGAAVAGFCDGGSGRAHDLAAKYQTRAFKDYKELVTSEDVNLIAVATPSGFHMEPTLLAAAQRKHVICEKPLEITLDRIDQMIEAHQAAGTYLGCFFPYRYNPTFDLLKSALSEGRFGRITFGGIQVPWWRNEEYYQDSWHGTWNLDGGGALMNQSIHMIDYLLALLGPVSEVKGFSDHLAHKMETEDTAVAVIKFESGALGTIYGATSSFPGQFRSLQISGTTGTVIQQEDAFKVWDFKHELPNDQEIRRLFSGVKTGGGVSDPGAIPYENHTRNLQAFLNAIENQRPFEVDGSEARKAVELILRIYES